jgi:hypothetical protein
MDSKPIIDIQLITTSEQRDIARNIVERHHSYVPTMDSVGRRIDWLIYHNYDIVGMIGIGSSVYPPPKDLLQYLGVSKNEYRPIFNTLANNWRFCLSTSIPNLGTQVLKLVRNDAPVEWKKKYGDDLRHILTFVGADKNGAVYKADNWKHIGFTAGLPAHKSSSMKWDSGEQLKEKFVKPTGENKKMIFITPVNIRKSKVRSNAGLGSGGKFFGY